MPTNDLDTDLHVRRWRMLSEHTATVEGLTLEFRELSDQPGKFHERRTRMIDYLQHRRNEALRWYKDFRDGYGRASTWLEPSPANSETPFRTRCYINNMVATCVTMHWWLLLFLNRMILRLRPSSQLQEQNVSIAEELCRTHEFAMRQKPFGSMFAMAATSLRIACADVKDHGTRDWISKALAEIDCEVRLGDLERESVTASLCSLPRLIEPLEDF